MVIHRSSHELLDADGRTYRALIHGRRGQSGLYEGWIEFRADDASESLATDVETTQPDRKALEYWAAGLEPLYLEGAFARASRHIAGRPAARA